MDRETTPVFYFPCHALFVSYLLFLYVCYLLVFRTDKCFGQERDRTCKYTHDAANRSKGSKIQDELFIRVHCYGLLGNRGGSVGNGGRGVRVGLGVKVGRGVNVGLGVGVGYAWWPGGAMETGDVGVGGGGEVGTGVGCGGTGVLVGTKGTGVLGRSTSAKTLVGGTGRYRCRLVGTTTGGTLVARLVGLNWCIR